MKINWKVRFKNPYFWIGLVGVVCCAIGVKGETITSWGILLDNLQALIKNPYMIASLIIALIGYVQDPTTKGLGDSKQALNYEYPKCEESTVTEEEKKKLEEITERVK